MTGGGTTVRPATAEDAAKLAALRVRMLREDHPDLPAGALAEVERNTAGYLREGLADGTALAWVAADAGVTVGVVVLALFRLPPNDWCPHGRTGYVSNLYVLPDRRRQGIARALMARLLDGAAAAGCQRILLHATDRGRALYEGLGFQPSADTMAYYRNCPGASGTR